MMVEWFEFFGGALLAVVTMLIRDAIMKNTFKHQIVRLNNEMTAQESINRAQESEIRTLREGTLELKTTMLNLRERFDDFYQLQKEEVKSIQATLNETNQRFASLDATLKGLTKWLERVENKLE